MLLVAVIVIFTLSSSPNFFRFFNFDPFADARKYRPLIQTELAKYQLESYTNVVVALMQQESHGRGGDPMQASESAGLARNSITDPNQSIQLGVKHFHHILIYGKQKNVDFATIIQAYNMGSGYINFVSQQGGKHSEELAKQYSLIQVNKKPNLYTCGGNKDNYRYPYCYGDFTYSSKVTKNIESLADSITAYNNQKAAGQSF
jgi:soluble lytic murein transglycosylase-like protein